MRKTFYILIIVLFSVGFAIGQTKGKPTPRKPLSVSRFADAEKAWIPFWNQITLSVRNREKALFKELIVPDYYCFEGADGGCSCSNYPDRRDIFFCGIDHLARWHNDPLMTWWKDVGNLIFNKKLKIGKIQSLEGYIGRSISYGINNGRSANFSFRSNNKWYLESMGSFGE